MSYLCLSRQSLASLIRSWYFVVCVALSGLMVRNLFCFGTYFVLDVHVCYYSIEI